MPYAVTVHFEIAPGQMASFLPLMRENATASVRDEPGCLQFDLCVDPSQPDHMFLYEVYTDLAAFEHHQTMPHYAAFGQAAGDMIAGKTVQTFDTVHRHHV